jgi:hypothetical protein
MTTQGTGNRFLSLVEAPTFDFHQECESIAGTALITKESSVAAFVVKSETVFATACGARPVMTDEKLGIYSKQRKD